MPSRNVIHKLEYARLRGHRPNMIYSSKMENSLKSNFFETAPPHAIASLDEIIDDRGELRTCIILGFTRDGNHLISYSSTTDNSGAHHFFSEEEQHYFLQIWSFKLKNKSKKISEHPLFGGAAISTRHGSGLRLTIMEDAEQNLFLIHGCHNVREDDRSTSEDHHITIVPSPIILFGHVKNDGYDPLDCIHLRYPCQDPFPSFDPRLNFISPNIMLINTGSAVHCLRMHRAEDHTGREQRERQYDFDETDWSLDMSQGKMQMSWSCTQPGDLNQVTLLEVNQRTHPNAFGIDGHDCFNAERYLQRMIHTTPQMKGLRLVDYELDILEVIGSHATLSMNAFYLPPSDRHGLILIAVIISFDLSNGDIQMKRFNSYSCNSNNKKAVLAYIRAEMTEAMRLCCLSKSQHKSPSVWTNKSVFSGQSVPFLFHPHLPIVLSIRKSVSE
ncbi:hypothetical protein PROFUN_15284 [Planoprotostelium fungivorum]|uniref:DDB1- and CUL4-associated factor 15 WD40 repeat-containing domain-containing protein n=1 Tax=Planoprotostelium fungivorum TaxID=1890364 RepID=A0A2P6MXH7_9EUKA|nr:hypothetical protein PROFUN_15284 [Planoprotostelium fungivorum]